MFHFNFSISDFLDIVQITVQSSIFIMIRHFVVKGLQSSFLVAVNLTLRENSSCVYSDGEVAAKKLKFTFP